MKDTLEYKILKFLSENDHGEPLDVSKLDSNHKLLKQKLNELKTEKLIAYGTGINISSGDGSVNKLNFIRAKIKFKGIEYLRKIESNNNITNNFNNSTVGQFNQDSNFSESPISIKTNEIPSKNPEMKSRLNKLLSNPWFIGISVAVLTALLNGKRVMNFINDILNNI